MNDLLSSSFSPYRNDQNNHTLYATGSVEDLDKFFEDVEAAKDELADIERIQQRLRIYNDKNKTSIDNVRSMMDTDVTLALKKAKVIKIRLESLDRSNAASRSLPNCGLGSASDRTRCSVVNELRRKLKDTMNDFLDLQQQMSAEYRETIQRRYFTLTGENPDEKKLDALIETGESETFLQKAIREQGRDRATDTVTEIHECYESVKEVESSLNELHQVFLDMGVFVMNQGEQVNDIESQMGRASSFVRGGAQELFIGRKLWKSSGMWMWTCIGLVVVFLLVFIVIVIVLIATGPKK